MYLFGRTASSEGVNRCSRHFLLHSLCGDPGRAGNRSFQGKLWYLGVVPCVREVAMVPEVKKFYVNFFVKNGVKVVSSPIFGLDS